MYMSICIYWLPQAAIVSRRYVYLHHPHQYTHTQPSPTQHIHTHHPHQHTHNPHQPNTHTHTHTYTHHPHQHTHTHTHTRTQVCLHTPWVCNNKKIYAPYCRMFAFLYCTDTVLGMKNIVKKWCGFAFQCLCTTTLPSLPSENSRSWMRFSIHRVYWTHPTHWQTYAFMWGMQFFSALFKFSVRHVSWLHWWGQILLWWLRCLEMQHSQNRSKSPVWSRTSPLNPQPRQQLELLSKYCN